MTYIRLPLIVIQTALLALISQAVFAADCMRLCDRSFMQTATVKDIQAEINKGADVRARNEDGFTPLHIVAEHDNAAAIPVLIKAGANIEARKGNKTSLHIAAFLGNVEAVIALIKAKADIDAKDEWDRVPLHDAAKKANSKTINVLIEAGADIEARTKSGYTPLHLAAFWGNAETVIALIKVGADGKTKTNEGETAFDYAQYNHNLRGTKALQMLKAARD